MPSESQFGELPIERIPLGRVEAIRRQAFDSSHDFFVSLVLNDSLLGSGTLVDAWGNLGILTAYHLAKQLDAEPTASLCAPLVEFPHRFEIPRECMEHIPLGKPTSGAPDAGPDLSFLRLSGELLIATLKSRKSFYRISGKPFAPFRSLGLEKLFWWIVGAPAEISRPMTSKTDQGALMAKHFIADAAFKTITSNGDFDVLQLILSAGDGPFPTNYEGASGGAVWVSSLLLDHPDADLSTVELSPCHLVGVMFYQGEVDAQSRTIEINCNGPVTLESRLEQFRISN